MVFIALGVFAACGAPRPSTSQEGAGARQVLQQPPAERSALVAALSEVIAPLDPRAAGVCLSFRVPSAVGGNETDAELLQRLSSVRTVVPLADCPPTYSRMIAEVDAEGRVVDPSRPLGYVDPYRVEVRVLRYFLPDSALFTIGIMQGMGGRRFSCRTYQGDEWGSECALEGMWIH